MSKYILCSSNSEEESGELTTKPANKTLCFDPECIYTNYLYVDSKYIGENSRVSRFSIAFAENKIEYIKNKLKKTFPFSCMMSFFSSIKYPPKRYDFHSNLEETRASFKLLNVNRTIENIKQIEFCKSFSDLYSETFDFIVNYTSLGDESIIGLNGSATKIILIEDSLLNYLNEFKAPFTVLRTGNIKKILFHSRCILEKLSLNKSIKIYGENCLKQSTMSKECRVFADKDVILIIFSTSVFMKDDSEFRLYKSLDVPKNCDLLVEENGIRIIEGYGEGLDSEVSIINSIDLDEGINITN